MKWNGSVYVGGYGYTYRELPASRHGKEVGAMIAEAVMGAMHNYSQFDGFKLDYIGKEQLNDLCFKVARKIQDNYSTENATAYVAKRLDDLCNQNMMSRSVADKRLANINGEEISFGVRIWAEDLIDSFDKSYKGTIARAINEL